MSELINNRAARLEALAAIIKELHGGEDPQVVKTKLATLVRATTSEEIVAMEQQLIAEGMSVDEIKGMCDLHAQVVGEILVNPFEAPQTPGHPVQTMQLENAAIGEVVAEMRAALSDLGTDAWPDAVARLRTSLELLLEVEKHYARKENILFPHLERHGITGPSQVMWAKDDEIRALLRLLRESLTVQDAGQGEWQVVAQEIATPLLRQVEEMIVKEESILLPLALKQLSAQEWGEIHADARRFGFCLVEPGTAYTPPKSQGEPIAPKIAGTIPLGAGGLTPAQLLAMLRTLPVDLTLVDADDRVVFFSEGPHRVFDRTRAIIGRKVQNCHPPQSVEVVERILKDFRGGAQDVAEFWIELRGRFVHITYHALRDETGAYLGTLEVTQDATHVRGLIGERRLLQYEEA